ncbi:hypothetical protein HETIRDRAFT_440480 [Heterobasidion irregulare TC 32-1]|uniref:Uncharacterized protein n=1 Tax=Heterobasidion irregulare (strain TC 32-1) TaxID=747525 RepID=W4K4T3_HETIT|nr:uncharacterized protein HETIRDRAFT_440480 [Heterobasidion irregulare TC 32-1]ETW80807.1 hypothetical protein HETIRDRAFT_440480 [Heterobasidion irregulare TC 32-1]
MTISCATRDHSASTPSQIRVQASPPCKDVERELQVMRDRHSMHAAELAAARSAKRKLEDACERERVARRRVERQMSDLERALARAERREESALEQIKSEVEARRVAEERAIAERKARVEAEEAIKEREKERQAAERELEKVQEKQREGLLPMFESLAGMFQRAAMGSVNMAGDGTRVPSSSGV